MGMKRLKDPIYGYIEITDEIIKGVVDTAEFQRLRSIVQTSYSPLYASAVHNRFVHSLGVYHLGRLVANSFRRSSSRIPEIDEAEMKKYILVFEYACLLHDVGHAPFSHTGESFYESEKTSRDQLHKEIMDLIYEYDSERVLEKDIIKKNYSAAPHELMSVIVALKSFSENMQTQSMKEFFARCILGYSYVEDTSLEKSFLNCLISMLNSAVIDVDKLDYLIRDAYIIGFDTVSIDYDRLLRSVEILCEQGICKLVFSKGAISVIENVVFAHDAERKWIQNHPVVLYDMYLLRHALEKLNSSYHVFDYDALTCKGKVIKEYYVHTENGEKEKGYLRISLLNDGDITFLMKNLADPIVSEYYSRKDRRHPLWKSEAEYKAIFNRGFSSESYERLETTLDGLLKTMNYVAQSPVLNDSAVYKLKEEIQKLEEEISAEERTSSKNVKGFRIKLKEMNKYLKWLECFKAFAEEQEIPFDFLLIKANQFNSGFGKMAFERIEVYFPEQSTVCNFKKVTNALSSKQSERDKFFYLYAYENKNINVLSLARKLVSLVLEEGYSRNVELDG